MYDNAPQPTGGPANRMPALNELGKRLDGSCIRANGLADELHALAERFMGSMPPSPTKAEPRVQQFNGTLGTIESDLNRLELILDSCVDALERLVRIA